MRFRVSTYCGMAFALVATFTRPAIAQEIPAAPSSTCSVVEECLAEWSCALPPSVPRISGTVTLEPGFLIAGDGKGPFRDHRDSSEVYVRAALNIHPTIPGVKPFTASRSFRIDLTQPADSSTTSLGVITDAFADFHAWGPTLARRGIESVVQYLQVGSQWKSALVHIDFARDGRYYMLQLGPEAVGEGCNKGGTAVYGRGTTAVTMSRPEHNVYIVEAPPGTVGRLFDITNKLTGAKNIGLYYTSFRAVFTFDLLSPRTK